jgi:hypothetical protein
MELMDPEPELERALATGQWDEISARLRISAIADTRFSVIADTVST